MRTGRRRGAVQFLPLVVVAVCHLILSIFIFQKSGELMTNAFLDPQPEKIGGYALFMLGLFFTLPGTVLSGIFGGVGLRGDFWNYVALGVGSLIWAYVIIFVWRGFLKPSDRAP